MVSLSTNVNLGESARNGKSHTAAGLVRPSHSPIDDADLDATRPSRSVVARPRWETRYARAAVASDLAATAVSIALHQWWGRTSGYELQVVLGLVLMALTAAVLSLTRVWDPPVLGQGSEAFSRLLRGLVTVAVVVGLVGLALKRSEVRPYVFGVIPVAFILAVAGRLVLRKVLHQRRRKGAYMHDVLAVGTEDAVAELIVRTRRATHHGWAVMGACTPTGTGTGGGRSILDVPVLGDLDSVAKVAENCRPRVVSVAQTPGWSSRRLHHLAWDLEGTGTELVVDPGLMEIAGPRLHVAAVDGLPLLRLTEPAFTGVPRMIKALGDRLAAALLLLTIAPILVVLAIAVRSDGGPVFSRQSRVGKHGKHFSMIKFRSMVVKAGQRQSEFADDNQASGPQLTLREDPRVTRAGAFLRKYSLDELPQLFNVLLGSMSMVGPRPPLPDEVAHYSRDAQHKLLVKPGLTGLWQISGRSDLSWEESVRLDLRYVENWTLALDASILGKTIGAILRRTSGGGSTTDDRSLCFSGLGPVSDTDLTTERDARTLETPTRDASPPEEPASDVPPCELPPSIAPESTTVDQLGRVRAKPFLWGIALRFGVAPVLLTIDLLAFSGAVLLRPGLVSGTTIVLGVLILCLIAAGGFYRSRAHLSVLDDLPVLLGRVLIAGMFMTSVDVIRGGYQARAAILATVVFAVLAVCGRSLAYAGLRRARRFGVANHRTLVVGGGQLASELINTMLEHPQHGLHPVGFIDTKPMQHLGRHRILVPHLGCMADLARVILEFNIRTVVVAFSSTPERAVVETLRECDRLRCEIFVVPRFYELGVVHRDTELMWGLPLVRLHRATHRTISWKIKRVLDVVLSAVLLVVLLPVLETCALLVYYETGRNVLFRQERVGLDGRLFMLLKFCTLRPTDGAEASTKWSIANDSRVGPLGRMLRMTSLDELPQLWNILRGDMSLVGPRPERPFFVEKFSRQYPRYIGRHRVPSGLTGLAQVNGLCGDTSIGDRANFDNFYIENWSLWEDCKILLRTVGQVFRWAGR